MGGNVFSSRILILLFNMHKMSSITVSINSGMKLQQNCCQTCISGTLINLLSTYAFLQIGSKLPKKYFFLGSYCFSYSHLGAFDTVWKTTQFPLPTDKVFHAHLNWKFFFFNILKQFCFDILKIKTHFGMENLKQSFLSNIQPSLSWENLLDPLARCKVENLWYPEHDKMLYARVVVPLKGILKWWKFF